MAGELDQAGAQVGPVRGRAVLRLQLGPEVYGLSLFHVEHLAGYAALTGCPEEYPDDYFLGWMHFRGAPIPVFDLSRVVCEQATPECYGSRILVVRAAGGRLLGLLAGGVTDTLNADEVQPLDLNLYLPMLQTMIPQEAA